MNHHAFLILSDPEKFSASRCQQALRIFADFDLSIPRSFIAAELDKRFNWGEGTAKRLLASLVDAGILESLSRGRASAGGSSIWILTNQAGWTPKSLMEQWERMEATGERVEFAAVPLDLSRGH